MEGMFEQCLSLATAPLFNTYRVIQMNNMFEGCVSLTTVPLYNTVNATDVDFMFRDCLHVESGALALYQQMTSQVLVPERHKECFNDCGRDTVTGAQELAQIPSDWQ
jgi:hypothetical protein